LGEVLLLEELALGLAVALLLGQGTADGAGLLGTEIDGLFAGKTYIGKKDCVCHHDPK